MKGKSRLDAIFKPRSVAMIGASGTPGKLGYDILYNLIHAGFKGSIYPVNPKADEILGLKSYRDIASIPAAPDLAVIVIPSRMVIGAIEECGKAGVKAAVIVTGGFAEAGEDGERLQVELAATARKHNVRLIGPNCQGVNHPYASLCASWPLLTTRGRMAFISQSGTVGAALMDWASEETLGVSVFVSLGNRADVDEADCVQYFNADRNTRVIALYVEGVKRPAAFLEALENVTKPVVILKAGRTARGRVAAESHTKSLAGTDEIYEAIFRKYKVHRADNLEELYDYAKALAYMDKPKGRRLLSISSSGGAAILGIDEAEKFGFTSPAPSAALQKRLRSFLPAHCGVSNPIDLTGDAITDPSLYAKVIAEAKSDYDTSIVIFGDPIHGASDIVTGKGELVVFCGGADVEREETRKMHRKGIPVYPTPERGVRALAQLVRFEEAPAAKTPHTAAPAGGPNLLSTLAAMALLKKYRVPMADTVQADTPSRAVLAAKAFGGPVALKIASPDVAHKSDAGGIRLNLSSSASVRGAFDDILETVRRRIPKARIDGVTVSAMAPAGGAEVILGIVKDPQYGHAIMFGLGGIFTEIFRDVRFCLLPASEDEFLRAIRGIRGWPVLAGVRGQKPKDVKALVRLMQSMARLVKDRPDIEQIDLNPVLVYEKGLCAVDWRIYAG
ncbi:MAG: CoA-binding protein [Deltaproteobacteria bacterium HGW-Deltaproteobacteria-19]|jgi:acetyltransferase|nr:MAG: CoA-binding protein [Deltaproteobacteria bacterium HGW-Deltaproteobacteria-19]